MQASASRHNVLNTVLTPLTASWLATFDDVTVPPSVIALTYTSKSGPPAFRECWWRPGLAGFQTTHGRVGCCILTCARRSPSILVQPAIPANTDVVASVDPTRAKRGRPELAPPRAEIAVPCCGNMGKDEWAIILEGVGRDDIFQQERGIYGTLGGKRRDGCEKRPRRLDHTAAEPWRPELQVLPNTTQSPTTHEARVRRCFHEHGPGFLLKSVGRFLAFCPGRLVF